MKFLYLFLGLLFPSVLAHAVVVIVEDGEVRTTQILMGNPGDITLIKEGGLLTTNVTSIDMINSNQFLHNAGTISTSGGTSSVDCTGSNSFILNTGLITTTGSGVIGIRNTGLDTVIINTGSIFTSGGSMSDGMQISGDNVSITNSGSIISTGFSSDGIRHDGGANAVIRNSGLILATQAFSDGISSSSDDVHIINSGTIKSSEAFAVIFNGGLRANLSLLRGSNLQGRVGYFDHPLSLNVERGLNLALTFDDTSPGLITRGVDAPFILAGNTIGVVDPTGFAMQADVVADLSDTILNGIYRHRFCCCHSSCSYRDFWIQGIGSYRNRRHNHDYVGYENWQGGFLIGYDRSASIGSFDIFAGMVVNQAEVDQYTQEASINSYICGLTYESSFCGTFLGLAIAVGYLDWDNKRFVMNNLVSDGVETARAAFGGCFLSPEITLARRFPLLFCHPLFSFNLRYAGYFIGDYNEKGSATNLCVTHREVDLLTTRFELALPYGQSYGKCCWSIESYVGAYGRYQVGGYRINSKLLGQSLEFNQEGPKNLGALLLGLRGTQTFGCFNLFVNLEASFDTANSSRLLGEGGIGWKF